MNEDQNIEYKQSWRDEYLKWICGFANATGGLWIVMKRKVFGEVTPKVTPKVPPKVTPKVMEILGSEVLVDKLLALFANKEECKFADIKE
ncbi:hypothetical protein [uncultured Bacteroides sp.]|uniref:AlbA family DNA-binding domain-containing protein n=1 Tax=uncultured Bacteroides sp. TaxID=162156 RepID=UPI0025D74A58|nr:hypothetical protein [uncultured Bacteroides sp.]